MWLGVNVQRTSEGSWLRDGAMCPDPPESLGPRISPIESRNVAVWPRNGPDWPPTDHATHSIPASDSSATRPRRLGAPRAPRHSRGTAAPRGGLVKADPCAGDCGAYAERADRRRRARSSCPPRAGRPPTTPRTRQAGPGRPTRNVAPRRRSACSTSDDHRATTTCVTDSRAVEPAQSSNDVVARGTPASRCSCRRSAWMSGNAGAVLDVEQRTSRGVDGDDVRAARELVVLVRLVDPDLQPEGRNCTCLRPRPSRSGSGPRRGPPRLPVPAEA